MACKVIILVGPPGAGKSTLSRQYEEQGFKIINQDKMGSRRACLHHFEGFLIRRQNIVIDRTNINKEQRKYFIDMAKPYGVELECIVLVVPPEECVKRIHSRKNHETITEEMSVDKKKEIVDKFITSYEAPDIDEGFELVSFKKCY